MKGVTLSPDSFKKYENVNPKKISSINDAIANWQTNLQKQEAFDWVFPGESE